MIAHLLTSDGGMANWEHLSVSGTDNCGKDQRTGE